MVIIFSEVSEKQCIKDRHSALDRKNLNRARWYSPVSSGSVLSMLQNDCKLIK